MPPSPNEDLDRWTRRLAPLVPPVLATTRDAVESLRGRRDRADANLLADLVLRDPLMTLRVLVVVAALLGRRLATPVTTVSDSLVLLRCPANRKPPAPSWLLARISSSLRTERSCIASDARSSAL